MRFNLIETIFSYKRKSKIAALTEMIEFIDGSTYEYEFSFPSFFVSTADGNISSINLKQDSFDDKTYLIYEGERNFSGWTN